MADLEDRWGEGSTGRQEDKVKVREAWAGETVWLGSREPPECWATVLMGVWEMQPGCSSLPRSCSDR